MRIGDSVLQYDDSSDDQQQVLRFQGFWFQGWRMQLCKIELCRCLRAWLASVQEFL